MLQTPMPGPHPQVLVFSNEKFLVNRPLLIRMWQCSESVSTIE
jgi:hypothetical protein